jgi:hypothetical protein
MQDATKKRTLESLNYRPCSVSDLLRRISVSRRALETLLSKLHREVSWDRTTDTVRLRERA